MRARVDLAPDAAVELRILLSRDHARDADRYLQAASTALRTCANALVGITLSELTLVDHDRAAAAPVQDAIVLERVPWWTTATSMAQELAAARAVSRRCWTTAFDTSRLPPWFVEGLAELTARRAVAPIFEKDNNPPGYAFMESRYFAGFIPRFVRIRLMVETDGAPVSAYRAHASVDADASPSENRDALTGKTVLALGTLERWLGRPVFDGIVAAFVRGSKQRAPQLADFERVASEVSGQQLSWFFEQVFHSTSVFDYGVDAFASEPDSSGRFVTTVTARRYGSGRFTGAAGAPIGGFDNGRGMTVRVAFADGQQRTDWWDGRDPSREFRYQSPAPAVWAAIDPDRVLLLDLEQTNNSRALAPKRGAAATRWARIYLQWMEQLLLTYASLA